MTRKQNRNEKSRVSYKRVRDHGHKPGYSPFCEKKIIKSKKENGYRYYLEEDILQPCLCIQTEDEPESGRIEDI